jgi:hypothetical protein
MSSSDCNEIPFLRDGTIALALERGGRAAARAWLLAALREPTLLGCIA